MDRTDPILKVTDLKTEFTVGHRRVHAVNGVSFELRRGTTLGIVGESGCGKSVTAHSILQLLPRNGRIVGGTVEYFDRKGSQHPLTSYKRDGRRIRAIRGQDIAIIFQDPMSSLDPMYKIGIQIAENLHQHEKVSKSDARKRIVKLLADLGIPIPDQRYDEYPHQFSGGMKQRVMIATAMVCHPDVLIADEPTTSLDVTIQAQILTLMKDIQKTHGTSIILITHNMGIVAETCDDVAVMYMGRIVECGTADHVFESPMHPYTRGLMRAVPALGHDRNHELGSIPGSTPDASEVFTGCEFEPRCGEACLKCKTQPPPAAILPGGHRVRCWCYEGKAHGSE